jgi:hypothetical protein
MRESQRSALYAVVTRCRTLLEEDFGRQLEGAYGVHADGSVEPIAHLTHLNAPGKADRQAIEAFFAHEEANGTTRRQARDRYVRESAYTCLNRLAALKLMEDPSRSIIQPSVCSKENAKGFQQFAMLSPEALSAAPDGGFELYLRLLFADLSKALGVLFDDTVPTAVLFPSQTCLRNVLEKLNDPELAGIWQEDETIGWVYQYFTPIDLRESARKASSAPRTSYELAFRNQFYTPHYVVSFLADNTLGRLWWQMRSGDETALTTQCRYLIRKPSLEDASSDHALAQKRDPRDLRILDPACGSGHFLLYCFDLLLTIYDEAYDDPDLGGALRQAYPERNAYAHAVPKLILAHNLHGIDIDLRAVQIAELALWLRAQRAYAELGIKVADRPRIEQMHIVCAEPMPGQYDLLGEFSRELQPAILGKLVFEIWDKMKLAGEAGSLLKIEAEIQEAVTAAREALAALPPGIQLRLMGPEQPQQLRLDPADLDDDAFWEDAGSRVVEALRAYARQGQQVSRQLFAQDAAQGMAFIDLMRQRYDVLLMNPPFGAASKGSKAYIGKAYARTKNDLYAAFVERGLELLREGGYLGAITSRTGFFLSSFQKWREEILLKECQMIAMADLGYGVLDTAMVETAAYIIKKLDGKGQGDLV